MCTLAIKYIYISFLSENVGASRCQLCISAVHLLSRHLPAEPAAVLSSRDGHVCLGLKALFVVEFHLVDIQIKTSNVALMEGPLWTSLQPSFLRCGGRRRGSAMKRPVT